MAHHPVVGPYRAAFDVPAPDQDLCTGDGLCEEIAPSVFTLLDDGLAYVKEGDKIFSEPGGPEGLANVPAGMEEATIESAEECPGECIFIEVE